MNAPQRDIRGVLITVNQGRLLLPNASVAEVITFSDPEPVENAPAWMLGQIRWRGWRLPLLSFSRFAGWSNEEGQIGAKVVVLKALGRQSEIALLRHALAGIPPPGDRVPRGARRIAWHQGTTGRHPLDGDAQRRCRRGSRFDEPGIADRQGAQGSRLKHCRRAAEPASLSANRRKAHSLRRSPPARQFRYAGCAVPVSGPRSARRAQRPGRVPTVHPPGR